MTTSVNTADREIIVSRLLNSSITSVWEAWTTANHIKNWWGPNGFTNTITKMDLVPGGQWNLIMHGPDGTDYDNESIFTEIEKHKKIAYNHISGHEFTATIQFEERGNQTYIHWQMLFDSKEELARIMGLFDISEGLKQNVNRLEDYLKINQLKIITMKDDTSDREIALSRLLNAPIELVWEVWTNPEHIKNWWGPNGFTNTISKMEVQPEGEWNLIMHGPDGTDYKNKSIFKEVIQHQKLVYDHISVPKFTSTITFERVGNQTQLDWVMLFETKEQLIQVVKTFNAAEGLKQNVEKLQAYLDNHKDV